MLDNFREEVVVKRNRGLNSLLYALCWVGIVVFGLIGLLNFSTVMRLSFDQAWFFGLGAFVVFGGAAFLLFRNKDNLRTEYEYTFTNGTLDVAKVLGNTRRKYLTALDVKSVESCGEVTHASFQRFITMKDVKKHNWFLNREAHLYYFYFTKNAVKHVIVLEITEEMLGLVRKYLPFGAYHA